MSVGDQLGLDDNSELLDQARQKWPAWVVTETPRRQSGRLAPSSSRRAHTRVLEVVG